MRPFLTSSLGAAAVFLMVGPIVAQPREVIVINIVKFDKERFAFAKAKEKPDQPILVRVNQVVTWTNPTEFAFGLVSAHKGSDGKPLFVANVPKKGNVSVRFSEKMF